MLTRSWMIALLSCALAVSSACRRDAQPSSSQTAAAPQIPAPPDVSAPPADAVRTATGLASKVLRPGNGTRHPRPNSRVMVHYTGWTTDGKMFDSSVVRGQPSTFGLDGVIAGWTEGLQLMFEGEKTRFWIPEKLAYEGKKAPYGLLVFDIELIKIGQ
jgi:FKBP-type peptidyl-prolyl cis-trans isomerase